VSLFNPLLTRTERETLKKAERRELRKSRRAERKSEGRTWPGLEINWKGLKDVAVPIIREMVEEDATGPEKMDEVLNLLVERVDDVLVWTWAGPLVGGVLEMVDGPALKFLLREVLRPHVQALYERLKGSGRLR